MQGLSSVREFLLQRIRAGIEVPGFGHPLYPDGDPRAAKLFDLLNKYFAADARSCVSHQWPGCCQAPEHGTSDRNRFVERQGSQCQYACGGAGHGLALYVQGNGVAERIELAGQRGVIEGVEVDVGKLAQPVPGSLIPNLHVVAVP